MSQHLVRRSFGPRSVSHQPSIRRAPERTGGAQQICSYTGTGERCPRELAAVWVWTSQMAFVYYRVELNYEAGAEVASVVRNKVVTHSANRFRQVDASQGAQPLSQKDAETVGIGVMPCGTEHNESPPR
jgi:hypothetical protein